MAYTNYAYTRINWQNKSDSLTTPLGKANLNRMDSAIYNIAENLNIVHEDFSAGKFDKSDAGKVIVGMPTWNPATGILAFRFYDGTTFQVDFNVEKIPVSFSMDSAGVITMTTSDGTEWTADIGDVVPDYVFEDSERIAFSRKKNTDGSYTVSADIRKGSITDEHLQPGYLASVTAQAGNAAASAKSASDSADNSAFDAKLAQSYTVGGSGVRQGEDDDNAKKYKEQCQGILDNLQQSGNVTGVKGANEKEYRHGNVNLSPENIGALPSSGKAADSAKLDGYNAAYFAKNGHTHNCDDLDGNWKLHRVTLDLNFYTYFNVDGLRLEGNSIEIGQYEDVVVVGLTSDLCWLTGWSYSRMTLSISAITVTAYKLDSVTVCFLAKE